MKKLLFYFIISLSIISCGAKYYGQMNSDNMNKLKLGMTIQQVTDILGDTYKISKNEMVGTNEIKVLSYRNADEFYNFTFENGLLKKWDRELVPQIQSSKTE